MKKIKHRIPGILIAIVLIAVLTVFMTIVIKTKLLPVKYILLAGGVFLLLAGLIILLTRDIRRKGAMVCGCIITVLLVAALLVGIPYLTKALDTLDQISTVDVEMSYVGIYVQKDAAAQSLSDLTDSSIGILQTQDRANTDKTLAMVQEQIGAVEVKEYSGPNALMDGLLQAEIDAVILNSAFMDLLADMEGYASVPSQLRELYLHQAETVIETVKENKEEQKPQKQEEKVEQVEQKKDDLVFTMYISGIDSREGLIAKSRSDVNIIATVNVDKRQVLLASTPRDFYVPLPISDGIPDKLTHAGIYGIDVSMGTLEMLYDTQIDYYFRVNFSGFEQIIDALGGITVYSEHEFTVGGHTYYKGNNTLNGTQALNFARERYSFADGDRQRGRNQMAVIKAVIEKAMSPSLLMNYTRIMDSISGSFETSMPYDMIAELVRNQLDKGGQWNIVSMSADGTGDYQVPYSMSMEAYVMVPDQATVDAVIEKMNQVKNGEILG